MSKYKAVTGNTQRLSYAVSTEGGERLSKQLASLDNTLTSTPITKVKSAPMLSGGTTDEKTKGHAMLARVALLSLERAGLCRRMRVLSGGVVKEIRVVFDPKIWTDDLRLLSEVLSEKGK